MSYENWRKEFYPVGARQIVGDLDYQLDSGKITDKEYQLKLLDHSIQKWVGFLPENVEKYKLLVNRAMLYNNDDPEECKPTPMMLSADTCSLCIAYNERDGDCTYCPIYKSGQPVCEDPESAYERAIDGDIPIMIEALQTARSYTLGEKGSEEEEVDPLPCRMVYRIQVGRGPKGSYSTSYTMNTYDQAYAWYRGVNVGYGYKKRLIQKCLNDHHVGKDCFKLKVLARAAS